jgi:hypothetical protein
VPTPQQAAAVQDQRAGPTAGHSLRTEWLPSHQATTPGCAAAARQPAVHGRFPTSTGTHLINQLHSWAPAWRLALEPKPPGPMCDCLAQSTSDWRAAIGVMYQVIQSTDHYMWLVAMVPSPRPALLPAIPSLPQACRGLARADKPSSNIEAT